MFDTEWMEGNQVYKDRKRNVFLEEENQLEEQRRISKNIFYIWKMFHSFFIDNDDDMSISIPFDLHHCPGFQRPRSRGT